jgi:predicted nuclease of predicted toxin-antitoxin system
MQPENFEYWIDANLSLQRAIWLKVNFSVNAIHLKYLGLLFAPDKEILLKASRKPVVILTKDEDFADVLRRAEEFPKIIWITVGNTSNQHLKKIILDNFEAAVSKLSHSYTIVEITASI